ncbi:hypothetical protein [[Kitasatospora] papulosa]|uniref:hypothetical protein n=1 Tax=[Kitasatospora] papulosa TaxID=1464011 RepID=UPI0012FE9759|nr:hypothetical protein [[Kitasatospora] papulosa]
MEEREVDTEGVPEPVGDGEAEPLTRSARIGAGLVGLLLTGAGAVGVFISDNQAGTVALVLAGAIFLLMLFGGTPLHSLGFGDANLRFAKRRREQAVREAIQASPEQAPRVLRDLESADSQRQPDPTLSALTERVYEDALAHSISALVPQGLMTREHRIGSGRRADIAIAPETEHQVLIEARYNKRGIPTPASVIAHVAGYYGASRGALLLVSNSPLSAGAMQLLRDLQESGKNIHFVQWSPGEADEALRHAVENLTQPGNNGSDAATA